MMTTARIFKMELIMILSLICLGIAHGQSYCNFEDGLCGFTQDKDDAFDWSIGNSETPTLDTGPSYDHTLGFNKSGQYLFIETSGQDSWSTARLSSPKYGPSKHETNSVCVIFYYHIYGDDAGKLSVYLRQRGKLSAPLWSKVDDQGDEWLQAGIQLKSGIDYQVVFEAKRGGGFRSDIALDDISIINGSCKGKVNIGKPSPILNSIIGTKMAESFPGGSTIHLKDPTHPNVRAHQQPSNLIDADYYKPKTPDTYFINLYDSKVIINLVIIGLFFWSVVIVLLVYVFLQRKPSKTQDTRKDSKDMARKRVVAPCTSVAIENPYALQRKSFTVKRHYEKKRPEPHKVAFAFPKTKPDEDEQYDDFKTRVGLNKGPASLMYMYSLMPEDIEFNLYAETFEDNRTSDFRETSFYY